MLKFLSVLVLFYLYQDATVSVVADSEALEKVFYQLDDVNELFKEFITKYDKDYNLAEREYRQRVFMQNLIKINRWNREQPGAAYKIGPFADISYEEFLSTRTGLLGNFTSGKPVKYIPKGGAPDSLDWREQNIVTAVKDQQRCGSCYIFAAIGNIESQHAKNGGQLVELSEQQSLDCNSNGCEGGHPVEVMQALVSKGVVAESDYPYEGQQGQCRLDPSKVVVKVTDGQSLSIGSEDDLKDAVYNYGPLAIGITTNEELQHWPGGVFTPTTCEGGGHAVLLVGYGTDNGTPYWLIKNSWGPNFCEQGYFRLIRGQGACHIGREVATATVQ